MNKLRVVGLLLFTINWIQAQPCLEGWKYRQEVHITSSDTDLSDYQVKVVWDMLALINEGKCKVDASDLRVLSENGQVLSHWIEPQSINTSSAILWVKVPTVLKNNTSSIYLFYGNKTALDIADGSTTFDLFDDFDIADGSTTFDLFDDFDNQVGVDPARWTSCGSVQVMGDKCTFSSSGSTSSGHAFLSSKQKFNAQVISEMYVENATGGAHLGLFDSGRDQGYGIHYEKNGTQTNVLLSTMTNYNSCYNLGAIFSDGAQLPAGQLTGKWFFSRSNTIDNHLIDWPGAPVSPITKRGDGYVNTGADQVVVGNGGQTGSLRIDWVRVRKYTTIEPQTSLGNEINLVPVIQPTVNSPVCEGSKTLFQIDSIEGAHYSWKGPNDFISSEVSPVIEVSTPQASGVYNVTVSISNGCLEQSASVFLQVDSMTIIGEMEGNTSACEGANEGKVAILNQVGEILYWETSGSGFAPWQTVTNQQHELTYTNLDKTTFFRAVVKKGVCPVRHSDSVLVELASKPIGGKVIGPPPACSFEEKATLDLIGHQGDVARWESSINNFTTFKIIDTNQAVLPLSHITENTTFRVLVKRGSCPSVYSIPFDLVVYPTPQASFFAPDVCDGDAIKFDDKSTISSGNISNYLWDFGDQQNSVQKNPSYTYLNYGEYEVKLVVTSSFGCKDDTIQTVKVNELPLANFIATDACFGEAVSLQNLSTISQGVLSYIWRFGGGTSAIEVSPTHAYPVPGKYNVHLQVTSDKQCVDSLIREVNQFVPPTVVARNDTIISKGFGVYLNVKGGTYYFWEPEKTLSDPNIAMPFATPLETTNYVVTALDENNCTGKDSVTITVKKDFVLIIPNIITPDDNGQNDEWMITNIQNYKTSVKIFNRLGKQIYESDNYQNNWNGLDGKDILPDGAYYYVITFDESEVRYQGAISILRNK